MEHSDVAEYLAKEIKQSKKLIKKVSRSPSEKAVHDLRVNIRRERTFLKMLKDSGLNYLSKKNKKTLKKIWKDLGAKRDLDIEEQLSEKFHIDNPKIYRDQKNAQKKLRKDLNKKSMNKFLKRLKKISFSKDLKNFFPSESISKLREEIEKTPSDPEHFHQYRILLKEIRYVLESMNMNIERFKRFQDILGELNDLRMFLKKTSSHPDVRKAVDLKTEEVRSILTPARNLASASLKRLQNTHLSRSGEATP